ncbi:MAG: metallopeptidase TldD-related protein [Pseudomonadota bacterium]
MGLILRWIAAAALLALGATAAAAAEDDGPLLQLLETQLKRSFDQLSAEDTPPYFLAYRVDEVESRTLSASFGAMESDGERHMRRLYVESRVGDYALDNTHPLRSDGLRWGANYRNNWQELPLDNSPAALKQLLWQATNRVYQQSLDHLAKVKANVAVKVEEEDASPDFSKEPATDYTEPLSTEPFPTWLWEDRLRRYSKRFSSNANILVGRVSLSFSRASLHLVNTEGTRVRKQSPLLRMTLQVMTKAEDGMELPLSRTLLAADSDGLPSEAEILAEIDGLIAQAEALRASPLVTAYSGPVLLEGRASAVFFHELLGHRVEGHRLRREEGAQTLKRKLGERILPAGFDVSFDPTLTSFDGTRLLGSYAVDDEGVKARRVDVVKDGVLTEFLMSRIPIEGFERSNGHGRAQALSGRSPVARQSNLMVSVADPVPPDELKAQFLEALAESEKGFGLIIREATGGFTSVNRSQPNALKVLPTVVYKVYPDGREELARGVDVIGTPLLTLSHIRAGGTDPKVFHGWCGAESGYVPVSLIAPTVLLDRLEVQRKPRSQTRPPILPNPVPEDGP